MALTLVDAQRRRTDEYEAGVIETFILAADFTRIAPIETIGDTEKTRHRTRSATTVGWRARGEMYGTVLGGDKDEASEQVFAMGAMIDIDKIEMRSKKSAGILAERTKMAVDGLAWTFNDAVINGDHADNENSLEGLKVRLALAPSTQQVYGTDGFTDRWLDARPFQIASSADNQAAAESRAQVLLEKLDEAVDACDGGTANACLTTRRNIRAVKAALRRLGIDKDQSSLEPVINPNDQRRTSAIEWNKPIWSYNGVSYFDMGLKANQVDPIIGAESFPKDAGGSSNAANCDPFYFLKLGDPYVHIIQQYSMEVSKPELLENKVTYRTVVDWPVSIASFHPRPFSKLAGVRAA